MVILAVDTSTGSLSVALSEKDALIWEQTLIKGESHSRHLQGVVAHMVAGAGLAVSDIDGYAVSCGPGSFTGVRIGVSAVKGLAFSNNKPVVSISALDALAFPFAYSDHTVCAMIDARRGEVYYAFYGFKAGKMVFKSEEKVGTPGAVFGETPENTLFTGTGAVVYRDLISERADQGSMLAPFEMNVVRSGVMARMAYERYKVNDIDDLSGFKPHYIRKSDAEINFRG